MKRTDDEIAMSKRLDTLDRQRQGIAAALRDAHALYLQMKVRKDQLQSRLLTLNAEIELIQQGQLVLGDRKC